MEKEEDKSDFDSDVNGLEQDATFGNKAMTMRQSQPMTLKSELAMEA